ncbi:MAG TPA: MaoC/PaaZ C-terminal domain-containing protein [Solirubrobacterales bacterium]
MSARAPDDLPAIGTRYVTRGRTVTEADVVMFAALTGDWHPQHTDAEWARSSPFGERIAHGLLVLSFALGLGGVDQSRVVALRRLRDVVFKRPARFGDTISAKVTVASARPIRPGTALVGLDWVVSNARGETLVRAGIEVLWRTDDAPAPSGAMTDASSLGLPDGVIPS